MSKADDSAQVQAWVESGLAIPLQANIAQGWIHYEFLGGVYDGVKMRLYPPFTERLVLGAHTYVRSGPKNGRSKRLTYRLVE